MSARLFPAWLLLFTTACSGGRGGVDDSRAISRDSAGILIVDNLDAGWVNQKPWKVNPLPRITIGSEDGLEETRFNGIAGVQRLNNGVIAVGDQIPAIRFFDLAGNYLSVAGRQGQGPGEFQGISLMHRIDGDSLMVWDMALRRLSVFTSAGRFGRTTAGPSLPGFFVATDILPDGSIVGIHLPGLDLNSVSPGKLETMVNVILYNTRSLTIDTVTTLLGGSSFVGPGPTIVSIPFSTTPQVIAAGRMLYAGSGHTYEVRSYSREGALRRILRLARPNPPLTAIMVEKLIDRLSSGASRTGGRLQTERVYRNLPFSETLPAYDRFVVDENGNLWISSYHAAPDQPGEWTVFDSTGRLAGDVVTPSGFFPYVIGNDYLLGVSKDSLGVERIVQLGLEKPD